MIGKDGGDLVDKGAIGSFGLRGGDHSGQLSQLKIFSKREEGRGEGERRRGEREEGREERVEEGRDHTAARPFTLLRKAEGS